MLQASGEVPSDTYIPEEGVLSDVKSTHKTIKSGASLPALTVLGAILEGAATSAAKSGGNTGNGTLTMDVTNPVRQGAKVGVYQVRFRVAATNNGTFEVLDPDGFALGEVVMAAGAGAFDNDIKFAIADGATDFVVGDGFDITVAAGSGKYVKCVKTAQDGSQVPVAILAADTDATSTDVVAPIYTAGDFALAGLTFDASFTDEASKLAAFGIGSNIRVIKTGYSG